MRSVFNRLAAIIIASCVSPVFAQINPNQIAWPQPACSDPTQAWFPGANLCKPASGGGGSMVYPPAGIAKSTGTAWSNSSYVDIVSLFASGSCTGYLRSNGTCDNGSVSGQATGVIPLATGASTIGAQSHLSDNGSVVSSSLPFQASGSLSTGSAVLAGDSNTNLFLNGISTPLSSSRYSNVFIGSGAGAVFGTGSAAFSTTATGTSGTNTITVASVGTCGTPMSCIQTYMVANAPGIPIGTTVVSLASTTITLSANLTANLSAQTTTFTPGTTAGAVLIGVGAGANMVANNGSVAIGLDSMYSMVTAGSGGEDVNSVCIGPYACYSDTGASIPSIGNQGMFEDVVLGNKTYMKGIGERNSVILGNHIYAPSLGAFNLFLGGSMSNSFGSTNSFIQGLYSTFIGGNMFNATPASNTTYTLNADTFIGANGFGCFLNGNYNTIIGAGTGYNTGTCPTIWTGTDNVYISSGVGASLSTGLGPIAQNWTTGSGNFVITGINYGGTGVLGGNLTTGNGNVIFGGGAGANIQSGYRLTAIGNLACPSATMSSTDTWDVCLGASSDISANVYNATSLGASAIASANGAVQIGAGTNAKANSLQFQGYNFLDSSGNGTFNTINSSGGNPTVTSVFVTGAATIMGIAVPGVLNAGTLSNYVGYSDLLAHTGWGNKVGSATVTENSSDVPPPYSGTQVNKLVFASGYDEYGYDNSSYPLTASTAYNNCVWIRGAVGGEGIQVGNDSSTAVTIPVTTNWAYQCGQATAGTGNLQRSFYITNPPGSATVYIAGVSTTPVGSSTSYIPINNGIPITTPVASVDLPYLSTGPVASNAGNLVNAASGVATLASGTVTVSATAACAAASGCIYSLTNCGPSGTAIGVLSLGAVTAGTSFVINAMSSTNTVATGDTSKVCWRIN